jgi:hypothetical protein
MKKIVLALALACAVVPLTFAQTTPPPKTEKTKKPKKTKTPKPPKTKKSDKGGASR